MSLGTGTAGLAPHPARHPSVGQGTAHTPDSLSLVLQPRTPSGVPINFLNGLFSGLLRNRRIYLLWYHHGTTPSSPSARQSCSTLFLSQLPSILKLFQVGRRAADCTFAPVSKYAVSSPPHLSPHSPPPLLYSHSPDYLSTWWPLACLDVCLPETGSADGWKSHLFSSLAPSPAQEGPAGTPLHHDLPRSPLGKPPSSLGLTSPARQRCTWS